MKNSLKIGLIAFALTIPLASVHAGELSGNESVGIPSVTDQIANSVGIDEERQRKIDFQLAPIKSQTDLERYTQSTPGSSPLKQMSIGAQRRFIASLRFNDAGLTSYEYSDLAMELSASQIYRVLELFGAQRTTSLLKGVRVISEADKAIMAPGGVYANLRAPDYPGYACSGRATCSDQMHSICMSSC